jgi:glycosyltransferase involved in cell wall biosynthesis
MKVAVLTTSYPRGPEDGAGRFVADAVAGARAAGVDVAVVSPATFGSFGVAYGGGIVQNLRREPWRAVLVPAFLAAYARAARRAAAGADLVHAHWLPSALAARATGKPYVLQLWGTDVELARRAPALARPLVRGAQVVVGASQALADAARELGARRVEIVPSGVDVPAAVGEPDEPPHVLYVGRLSEEKGVEEFLAATEGLRRVVIGDGPLRARVPEAQGFVPPSALGARYERAAVVCVPSRREGYGMTAREAMGHGRAVVATAVGGLVDAVEDGVTGLLVPPRDPDALREAVVRLLDDADLRARLGAAARERARTSFSREAEVEALLRLWGDVRLYRGAP